MRADRTERGAPGTFHGHPYWSGRAGTARAGLLPALSAWLLFFELAPKTSQLLYAL